MDEGVAHAGRNEGLRQSPQVGLDHSRNVVDGVLGEVIKVCREELGKECGVCVLCCVLVCVCSVLVCVIFTAHDVRTYTISNTLHRYSHNLC